MDEMFKELGKYMIDVSKYVFTTILLSVLFADNSNMSLYIVTAVAVSMVLLALGLGFIKDFNKGGKE
jgi:hypothetical protein|nr:MAG TPA: hypothetical protein [Caudoviricetes sp.]